MNYWGVAIFITIFALLFGYFYLQKYWNECSSKIKENIDKKLDIRLGKIMIDFPSLNDVFDKTVSDKISEEIVNQLTPYSSQLAEYGITKDDIDQLSKDKELNQIIHSYIKENGYSNIKNDPKKQEELKMLMIDYVKENRDNEKVQNIKDKIQESKKPIPSDILDKVGIPVSTIQEVTIGTNNIDVNQQVDKFKEYSAIPNREQDNLGTGAVELAYLRG